MAYIGMLEITLALIWFSVVWWLSNRGAVLFNWPVVGMIPQLAANLHRFHEWSKNVAAQGGGTLLFKGPWFVNMNMLCTADPVNIKHIMSTNFNNYPKGPQFKEIFQELLGDGIFNSDFDTWRYLRKIGTSVTNQDRFRKLLMKTTSAKVERKLFTVLEHVCDHVLIVDLQDLCQRFTLDTSYKMVIGHDPETLNKEFTQVELFAAMDYVEEAIFYRNVKPKMLWKLQRLLGLGQEKKMKLGCEILNRIVDEYITRKREQLKDEESDLDLLTKLLNEKEIQGPNFTNKFLRDSILNFVFAARENSVAWFFWLVANNRQVKDKIREELKSILPTRNEFSDQPQFFEPEKLNKLEYLQAAICETLRLYPVVMYERKEALEPEVLPTGHYVDPKMKIFIPLYVMGRLKSVWGEDSEEFKPERWISDQGKLIQHSPYKFISFSAGPRTCMGREMALIQMKAISAFIVQNYDYQVIKAHPVLPNYASFILHMKHGCMVKFTRRFA